MSAGVAASRSARDKASATPAESGAGTAMARSVSRSSSWSNSVPAKSSRTPENLAAMSDMMSGPDTAPRRGGGHRGSSSLSRSHTRRNGCVSTSSTSAASGPDQCGEMFDDLDPCRGTVMARVPAGTRADAAAFAGFQVLTATRLLRQAANWGYLPAGEVIRSDMPGTFALALRRPLGVVAGISPWNGAHVLAWRTVVNPVAFGNTVVLKPSEEAPVSAGLLVAEIMAEAGFPPGVINVITHAPGEATPVADEFFSRPEVRRM